MLHKLLDGWQLLTNEQRMEGLLHVLGGSQEEAARLPDLAFRVEAYMASDPSLRLLDVERHPVVLVLDKQIQQMPWESLPCLQVNLTLY